MRYVYNMLESPSAYICDFFLNHSKKNIFHISNKEIESFLTFLSNNKNLNSLKNEQVIYKANKKIDIYFEVFLSEYKDAIEKRYILKISNKSSQIDTVSENVLTLLNGKNHIFFTQKTLYHNKDKHCIRYAKVEKTQEHIINETLNIMTSNNTTNQAIKEYLKNKTSSDFLSQNDLDFLALSYDIKLNHSFIEKMKKIIKESLKKHEVKKTFKK